MIIPKLKELVSRRESAAAKLSGSVPAATGALGAFLQAFSGSVHSGNPSELKGALEKAERARSEYSSNVIHLAQVDVEISALLVSGIKSIKDLSGLP